MPVKAIGRYYWTVQTLTWAGYATFNLAIGALFETLTSGVVLIYSTLAAGLFAASHAMGEVLRRRHWFDLTPGALAWRLVIAVSIGAALVQLLISAVLIPTFELGWITMPSGKLVYTPISAFFYWFNCALILALWTFIYVGYTWFDRWRSGQIEHWRTESALREAELSLLKAQLDPHFLFNALNNIRATITEDPARAREMVTRLSQVLRHVLQHARRDRVTLREELDAVRDYLAIMGLHFENRLSVQEDVAPAALEACVPPLLLQLLVENAIKHGVSRHQQPGLLEIRATKDGEVVWIEVFNDGELGAPAAGVGLTNLSQRLTRTFGSQASLTLEQVGPRVRAAVSVPQ